jgi:type II secretory pathway pseudopilin PulG
MELLIVVSVINILVAVAIVAYIGARDKARLSFMLATAETARSDLYHWLHSSLSNKSNFREVDTNFDGKIDENDKTNGELYNHVAEIYTHGRNTKLKERSPWFNIPLWSQDDPPPAGTIGLIQLTERRLKIIVKEKNGQTAYEQLLIAE